VGPPQDGLASRRSFCRSRKLLCLAIRRNGTRKIQIFFTILATNLLQPGQMLAGLVEISCLDISLT
jgi:hypothetical protein